LCSVFIDVKPDRLIRSIEYNKGCKCDVCFLLALGVYIEEWEFTQHKRWLIGINQSILNGLLNHNLNDKQAKKVNIPFYTNGQMLVKDLVESFYIVFPLNFLQNCNIIF
jgi:hypothetical protein